MFSRLALLLLLFHIVSSSQSVIKTLPGFSGNLPFKLETGYIGVGESDELQMFYYFVESESNPQEDPLLLWLTGGPGCSGLSGLLYEIGPFTFNYTNSRNKPTLELNPYSWSKVANIIFLDAPAGAGFSYATTWLKYYNSDTTQGTTNYEFLRKWLLDHPEFQSNMVYIAGDSYSGKIVPLVVQEIDKANVGGLDPQINLQGYVLGNPVTDYAKEVNSRFKFAYMMGLVSEKTYKLGKRNCKGNYTYADPNNTACHIALRDFEECTAKIDIYDILEPICITIRSPKVANLKWNHIDIQDSPSFLALPTLRTPWCRNNNYILSSKWANDKTVQNALHIREGTVKDWARCNRNLSYTYDLQSSYELHRDLVIKDYKVLIYSGDHDMCIPHFNTLEWIESLNLTISFDWQPWFVDGQVAGYWMNWSHNRRAEGIMTYATVKGAGHTAAEHKPKECLAMINRWLASFPL